MALFVTSPHPHAHFMAHTQYIVFKIILLIIFRRIPFTIQYLDGSCKFGKHEIWSKVQVKKQYQISYLNSLKRDLERLKKLESNIEKSSEYKIKYLWKFMLQRNDEIHEGYDFF